MDANACPCAACARHPQHSDAEAHRRIRALLSYARPEERPWCAAMLPDGDDVLAAVTGIALAELARCRGHLRLQENDLTAQRARRVQQMAGSRDTLEVLMSALRERERWRAGDVPHLELELVVEGRRLHVRVPPTRESILLAFEIFADDTYRLDGAGAVPVIYDVGANVGLAALYLHVWHPTSKLVCVEPLPSNVALLCENLQRNGVNAEVLPCAVAPDDGEVTLHVPQDSHAMASTQPLHGWTTRQVTVPARSFSSVLSADRFGLKLDAEGAEHLLTKSPEVLRGARWVVGELHVGEGVVSPTEARAFEELLRREFALELAPAEAFGVTLTRAFKARRT
ncbi:MAG: FkbM family methyltransferase [Myxococcota bacterium]